MNYDNKLMNLIEINKGIVLSKDADKNGIPREYLSRFIEKGNLERVERGVYLTPDAFDDEMYRLQLKYKSAIFSHENALFLNNLTDIDPLDWAVTVPAGYNSTKLRHNGIVVYSVRKELYEIGIIEKITPYGRIIKTYDIERSICDIVRSRSKIDVEILINSIKRYAFRSDKNITKLLRIAEEFNIQNILRKYLEVIL